MLVAGVEQAECGDAEGGGALDVAGAGDLAAQGTRITAVPETDQAAWVPQAAKMARSPWVVPWQAEPQGRPYDDSYLLDLACARECAQADAVGYAAGSGYAYVTSLDPVLARREFFGPDGSQSGLRFFSLS